MYVNAKIPRLGSMAAKVKLKQIGGSLFERWSVWINSIIRAKSYQCVRQEVVLIISVKSGNSCTTLLP